MISCLIIAAISIANQTMADICASGCVWHATTFNWFLYVNKKISKWDLNSIWWIFFGDFTRFTNVAFVIWIVYFAWCCIGLISSETISQQTIFWTRMTSQSIIGDDLKPIKIFVETLKSNVNYLFYFNINNCDLPLDCSR